uniref:Uncharacterized protein n=1 Tax=Ornithorhynchus anatinus TaxID=9258 RepID=A0A6I8P1W7_ORNAN
PSRPIDGLRDRRVIQVACGDRHSMALTRDGELFSWGDDEHGQLGLERAWVPCPAPQRVCALAGVPLARMEAGGAHSLALSATGAVFAWGRNDRGQLGLGHAQGEEGWGEVARLPRPGRRGQRPPLPLRRTPGTPRGIPDPGGPARR